MTRPDFSGEWILDKPASTLSPGAADVKSAVYWIDHRDPVFRKKAQFVFEGATREFEYELVSDGREVVSNAPDGETTTSLHWEDDALVETFRTRHPDGEMNLSFRFELIEGGRRLRAVEDLRGTDHDQDNVWVFERARA